MITNRLSITAIKEREKRGKKLLFIREKEKIKLGFKFVINRFEPGLSWEQIAVYTFCASTCIEKKINIAEYAVIKVLLLGIWAHPYQNTCNCPIHSIVPGIFGFLDGSYPPHHSKDPYSLLLTRDGSISVCFYIFGVRTIYLRQLTC